MSNREIRYSRSLAETGVRGGTVEDDGIVLIDLGELNVEHPVVITVDTDDP